MEYLLALLLDHLVFALVAIAAILAVGIFITLAVIWKLQTIRNQISDDDSGLF